MDPKRGVEERKADEGKWHSPMLLWGLHSVESSEADAKVSITARLNQDKTKAKDYNNDQVAMAAQLEPIK